MYHVRSAPIGSVLVQSDNSVHIKGMLVVLTGIVAGVMIISQILLRCRMSTKAYNFLSE